MAMLQYSPLCESCSIAVARNGIEILKMPKFSGKIAKTVAVKEKSGFWGIRWVDSRGAVIYEKRGCLLFENEIGNYPMIGEFEKIEEE